MVRAWYEAEMSACAQKESRAREGAVDERGAAPSLHLMAYEIVTLNFYFRYIRWGIILLFEVSTVKLLSSKLINFTHGGFFID